MQLIAAPFTPMLEDGRVNLRTIELQARALVKNGVAGAFVCGTTGEGMSLTTAERLEVAERWAALALKPLQIIVHVGHNSIEDSKTLARHAEQIGAHGIAAIAPSFFRPATVEDLVEFCEHVTGAAPALPFYFYHFPSITGVNPPMLKFLKLAGERIPNFAGLKFSHDNLLELSECLNFGGGQLKVFFGRDEMLLAAMAMGATRAVGSTYNFMAPVYHQLCAALERGDLQAARRHQIQAIEIIAVMNSYGGIPAGKAMMKMAGIDCGPVRLPLRNLSPAELEHLRCDLERAGFAELARSSNG